MSHSTWSGNLPSIVYGYRKCSFKWKHEPQEKWANAWTPARDAWERGQRVTKWIGYAAEEGYRAAKTPEDDPKYRYRHPLMEWDMDTDDCVAAIERAGLPPPPKSACFFCPASKKREVLDLSRNYPELFQRALDMEAAAGQYNQTVKGLGRSWSWGDLVRADAAQTRLFADPGDAPCMCFDGEDD